MSESKQVIIQLDKKTINKIAAGEVVERPASVVKELIENSLDAEATEISVLIKGHGLDEIKVIDNGVGMSKEDAALAWKSHTTSKLKTVEDLDAINSLGFRGEALASIASVSTMEILTRRKDQDTGTFVRIKGGDLELFEERECSLGTNIIVKNLFFNVPARKKFLKTKTTELGHIIEIVTRQSLIRPNIHFKLLHEKSVLLNSPKSKNSLEPFISVFGVEIARQMIPIKFEKDDIVITGYTSNPDLSRSTRHYEMLYINKRYVKSSLLSEAIEEVYKTLLMKNRYPVTLLNIEIASFEIDVNIHPTKREVRFNNAKKIFEVVKEAIADSLSSSELWRKDKSLLKKASEDISMQSGLHFEPATSQLAVSDSIVEEGTKTKRVITDESTSSLDSQLEFTTDSLITSDPTSTNVTLTAKSDIVIFSETFWLKPLGQAHNLYALCQSSEGIAVVDIHAAHERIRYEQLLTMYKNSKIQIQELLQPITFQLTKDQTAFMGDYLPQLKELGIEFELFGGNTYIVRRLPVIMDLIKTDVDIQSFIDEMKEEVVKIEDVSDRIDLIIKTMACHSVVRSGDSISVRKIVAILGDLSRCKNPYTCPHGRPTIIKISKKSLEKEFGRIV
ncbi:MAG: DNA mismatch repair endonuclease MutL [Candidatus Heimdallarchaeota archaeon]|nr:DNA mismatch repair endonuclease MutL [Candidatus Heimdallarchaeota archaeon]